MVATNTVSCHDPVLPTTIANTLYRLVSSVDVTKNELIHQKIRQTLYVKMFLYSHCVTHAHTHTLDNYDHVYINVALKCSEVIQLDIV